MGARNVLPVTCGWAVKGFFWLRGFTLPAWPRFLLSPFPTLGIHENMCVCALVCASAKALSFPLQRQHCLIRGQATTNVPNCECTCICVDPIHMCIHEMWLCELTFVCLCLNSIYIFFFFLLLINFYQKDHTFLKETDLFCIKLVSRHPGVAQFPAANLSHKVTCVFSIVALYFLVCTVCILSYLPLLICHFLFSPL